MSEDSYEEKLEEVLEWLRYDVRGEEGYVNRSILSEILEQESRENPFNGETNVEVYLEPEVEHGKRGVLTDTGPAS